MLKKTIKTRDDKTFAEATKASPEISIQTENSGQYAKKHSSEKQHDSFPGHQIALSSINDRSPVQAIKNDSQQSPGQNRLPNGINVPISGVITAPRAAKQSADDERQMKSEVAADLHPRNIPVYLSNDANMVSRREKFDFHGNNRKQVDRYFVSGISKDSSENGMRSFLEENGVRFTFIRFFAHEYSSSFSAQLNVERKDSRKVQGRTFWPTGIRIRRWIPRNKFYYNRDDTQTESEYVNNESAANGN